MLPFLSRSVHKFWRALSNSKEHLERKPTASRSFVFQPKCHGFHPVSTYSNRPSLLPASRQEDEMTAQELMPMVKKESKRSRALSDRREQLSSTSRQR